MPNETAGTAGIAADSPQLTYDLSDAVAGAWRRSSRCGAAGSCVEVADLPAGSKAVRDGKLGDASPALIFTTEEWQSFLSGVKAGDFG